MSVSASAWCPTGTGIDPMSRMLTRSPGFGVGPIVEPGSSSVPPRGGWAEPPKTVFVESYASSP